MDARRLDDALIAALVTSGAKASAAAAGTQAGGWLDTSQWEGDILICVDVSSLTGSGTLALQAQAGTDVNGTGAVNVVDPRGTVLDITATGDYVLAIDADKMPARYLGLSATFTTITGCTMCALAIARGGSWSSGASD